LLLVNVLGLGLGVLVVNIKRSIQASLSRRGKPGTRVTPRSDGGGLASLRWFVGGIALVTIYIALGGLWQIREASWMSDVLLVPGLILAPVLVLGPPFCFTVGASHAWWEREDGRRRARLSRWLNIVALAIYLGVIAHLVVLGQT
jgi:hypothetical protein